MAGSIKWQYADEKSVTYAEPSQPRWNHSQAAGTNWKHNPAEVEKCALSPLERKMARNFSLHVRSTIPTQIVTGNKVCRRPEASCVAGLSNLQGLEVSPSLRESGK
jgi:hypothetical protein